MHLHLDPFCVVLRELTVVTTKERFTISRMILELCRAYLSAVCVFGAYRIIFLVIASFITMIGMIQNTFQLLNDKLIESNWYTVDLNWNLICYNSFTIIVNMCQFAEIVALVSMAGIMLVLVLFHFITIRLYNFFPFYIWVFFPIVSVISVGAIQLTIPQSVKTTILAAQLKAQLILTAKKLKSPYMRKRIKAMCPLRINVGFPGYTLLSFSKSTKATYYWEILCHTINLIIAVP